MVLVILSALAGLAMPAIGRMAAGFRQDGERQAIERQLRLLPLKMRQNGDDGWLVDGETGPPAGGRPLVIDLPADWRLQPARPIRYHPSGACDGGEVMLSHAGLRWRYVLTPPLCRPRQFDAVGP